MFKIKKVPLELKRELYELIEAKNKIDGFNDMMQD